MFVSLSRSRSALAAAVLLALAAAPATAQLSAADRTFATLTAQANTYEVRAARLATTMAIDPTVKAYAQTMIGDHTNLAGQLNATLHQADPQFTPAAGVGNNSEADLELLRTAGPKFDSTYKAQMISSHTELQALFQQYVDSDKPNAGLKSLIVETLPAVQKHLTGANALPGP
jgi:putative membrane protein